MKLSYFLFLNVFCFSDDEDDTAELLAELQRIKKERAQEEAKKVNCSPYIVKKLSTLKLKWVFFFIANNQ